MTDYGLTDTGYNRKTYAEHLTDIETLERARISAKLDLSEADPLGNVNRIVAEKLAELGEAAEAAVGALDPDNAVDHLLVGLCKLTGVRRLAANYGHVVVTCTFDRATTIAAGALIVYVDGEASNQWTNDAEITVTGAGDEDVDFTSVNTGSDATAASGTLTEIATPISGLTAVTNVLDATPGTDIETLDELRARREASLSATGKGTVGAVRAEVLEVDGVLDCRVIENDTNATVDSVPARTIRVVVWDDTTEDADDDELAQAIYDSRACATPTYGAESGSAEDPWGDSKTIYFDRADQLEVYIDVEVEGDTTETAVKAALIAAHDSTIEQDVLYAALLSAAYNVEGVTDVVDLTLGLTPSPSGTSNIPVDVDEIGVLDTSRIGVTLS